MEDFISVAFKAVWACLAIYWLWNARNAKQASRAEPAWLQLAAYWTPLAIAFLLLGPGDWFEGSVIGERFVPKSLGVKALGLVIAASGLALAVWSRHLLGRNWSSVVQLKEGHDLIEAGPYRYVRHPIYSGLLLIFLGTALKVGDWRGLLALAVVLASFWRKLRVEERWLTEQFGDRYRAYRQRTKAIVPGVV